MIIYHFGNKIDTVWIPALPHCFLSLNWPSHRSVMRLPSQIPSLDVYFPVLCTQPSSPSKTQER